MMNDPFGADRRALDLFDAAMDHAPQDRSAWLHAAADGDARLIAAVTRLLDAQRRAHLLQTQPPAPAPLTVQPPPERVGVYRLTGIIGRGGMGTVHRGARVEGGFEQAVAIKLIRDGLFSHAATERFAQERRILAQLRHPHITQLFDGGTTPEGQSYIVMELITGQPLTEHCTAGALGLRARLALFADVCAAVGHAHQCGVVHADIKPGNILVDALHGVKLLDFGISGLIGAEEAGGRGATPAYASPQQRRGERAIPADDIYALGRLLETLVEDCAGTDADLACVAARARAPLPEQRYAAAGELSADIARWQGGYPVRARPAGRLYELRLFWRRHRLGLSLAGAALAGLIGAAVTMTALEIRAEAARRTAELRYNEVHALARYMLTDVTDSLQRFPGTSAIRRELADRGRTYLEGLSRLPGADDAIRLEVAEGYAKTGEILGTPDLQSLGDPAAARRDLDTAEAGLRALLRTSGERGDVAIALAHTLTIRAAIAFATDNASGIAQTLLGEATRLATEVLQHEPGSAPAQMAVADAALRLAAVMDIARRPAEMAAPVAAALAALRALPPGADPVTPALMEARAWTLAGDAAYWGGNDLDGALTDYQRAASVLDGAARGGTDVRLLERQAYTAYDVASIMAETDRLDEALAMTERGTAKADLLRAFENSPRAWHVANIVHMQRAIALSQLKRFAAAIGEMQANLASRRASADAAPDSFEEARAVLVGVETLGTIYAESGDEPQACAQYADALAGWDALGNAYGVTGHDAAREIPHLQTLMDGCRSKMAEDAAP